MILELRLGRYVEQSKKHFLLVEWDRLEDHTEGFRGSRDHERWRELRHHFYEPSPTVEHYHQVLTRKVALRKPGQA